MPDVSIICREPRGMRRARPPPPRCKLIGWRQGASNKTSNKASNTKIGRRSKALICVREFEQKFGTGALHPLQSIFNSLA
jgi:hypothetical protein